ncbi:MAG TPA: radical SAM protein [Candidatus Elarobacter sp.]
MKGTKDGALIIANSYSGGVVVFDGDEQTTARRVLREGLAGEPADTVSAALVEHGFLIPGHANEAARLNLLHQSLNESSALHLIVMPTEDCNFRCTYCYESFLRGAMSPKVRRSLKMYLLNAIPRLRVFQLSWFGGEPLFAFDVVKDITAFARQLCEQHGVTFRGDMTTNGYQLDAARLDFLATNGITQFQITLDGDADTHDETRKLAVGGGSTFDVIWQNLVRIHESAHPISVSVRSNVGPENVAGVERLVERVAREFKGDKRFTFMASPIWDYDYESNKVLNLVGSDFAGLAPLRSQSATVMGGCPSGSFGAGTAMCYAGKMNSLVVGSDGALYKCTVAFDDPRNKVGRILDNGDLSIDVDRMSLWVAQDYRTDTGCQKCFYAPACMGSACPLVRITQDKAPCPETKVKIAKTLEAYYDDVMGSRGGDLVGAPA